MPRILVKKYPYLEAKVIDHRFKVAKVSFQDNSTSFAHAPDPLGGSFYEGCKVMIVPIDQPKGICLYRVIAIKRDSEWFCANPAQSERLCRLAVDRGLIPFLQPLRNYPRLKNSVIDLLCNYHDVETYVEIKACNLTVGSCFLLPTRDRLEDLAYLKGSRRLRIYSKPVSPRSIKQGQLLAEVPSLILFVCGGGSISCLNPFMLNPRDPFFKKLYGRLKALVLHMEWTNEGVYFRGLSTPISSYPEETLVPT